MNEVQYPRSIGGQLRIIPSRGWSATRFAEYIDRWGVTHTLTFPSMLRDLIQADSEERLPLASMIYWYTGGENCPPNLMSEVRRRWSHIHLVVSYGSTESGMVTWVEDEDIEKHPGRLAGSFRASRLGFWMPMATTFRLVVSGKFGRLALRS
ncbi:AMP-binding protein (plasmid) [Sinorhizobium meliloti]|nr:AMP-binding protein [Sinorhizobium meliloti]